MLKQGRPWFDAYVKTNGYRLSENPDALLCFGLVPSLELGTTLNIPYFIDDGLLKRSRQVQELISSWTPVCRPIEVKTLAATGRPIEERQSHAAPGLFFSGGVDSAYSLAMNQANNKFLISIIGCDFALTESEKVDHLINNVTAVAEDFGQQVIFLETDLPTKMQRYLGWIEYHGSALAGFRHLLTPHITEMRVASSVDERGGWEIPWGSHPGIDPRLGTQANPIYLDGLCLRVNKIKHLADSDSLLRHLRVCYHGGENCGRCSKCIFTWWCLRIHGIRDGLVEFQSPELLINPLHLGDDYMLRDFELLLALAEKDQQFKPLCDALLATINKYRKGKRTERFRSGFKSLYRVLRHQKRFAQV